MIPEYPFRPEPQRPMPIVGPDEPATLGDWAFTAFVLAVYAAFGAVCFAVALWWQS